MVRGLQQESELRLVEMFQQDPLLGRVGIALFCRYDPQVTALLQQLWGAQPTARLWHQAWHHLFDGLLSDGIEDPTLWIQQKISLWYQVHCIEHSVFEPGQGLDPSAPEQSEQMGRLSPVLTWYVKLALERLDPLERFVLLLKDRFGWADEHIVGQLQKEGYPHLQIQEVLHQARYLCLEHVPPDIRALYLASKP
jgi:hypothetical protein